MPMAEPARASQPGLAELGQYRQALWVVWASALLLIGLIAGYAYQQTVQAREREIESANQDLANLTRLGQEHAERVLRSADQVIRFVQDAYLRQGKSLDLQALTRRGVIDAQIFNQVGIIDAKGIYILANRPIEERIDLSDREHFRVHLAGGEDQLWVSKPVVGRATQRWSIQLTRRIMREDGTFAGVVVVSVDPGYFTRFYGDLNLGNQGEMSLVGLDGVVRARRVGTREEFGVTAPDAPLIRLVSGGQTRGGYRHLAGFDGVERFYQFRKLSDQNLVLVSGMATSEVLGRHRAVRAAIWEQATMMVALTLLLAAALVRYFVKLRAAMVSTMQAQHLLQERTEQLDAIFSLSPDGFVSFDKRKRVLHVNAAFQQLTGSENLSLQGLDERDFSSWLSLRCIPSRRFAGIGALQAEARGAVDQPSAALASKHLIEIDEPVRRVLQVALREQSGSAVSQLLHLRDVTTETRVDAAKSEFMAVAAHELRAPMTSILGYSEILLSTEIDPGTQRELLTTVLKQSRLMAHILDELLDLARIEAGKGPELQIRPTSVWDLIKDTLDGFTVPVGRAAPVVDMADKTLFVRADARKIQQALNNLLSNAYKYSLAPTPVLLRVGMTVDVQGRPMVSIAVRDQGIGMSAEQTKRVFERFYRADTTGRYAGSGLGMSIVKEIINLHRGEVRIDSEPGQGSQIALCLPAD